jgi:hypothetical protein
MKSRRAEWLAFCCVLLLALACGPSIDQKQLQEASKKMEEAGKKMEEAAKQGGEGFGEAMKKMGEAMTAGKKVEPVDFRTLKGLLPESLPGMKRTDAKGEKTAAFGINVSKAEGTYQADSGANIDISISDMGSMTGLTAIAAYGWAMADIDRETDNSYEKTTTYSGHKAHEKYEKSGQHGEIEVLVANRFVVELKGNQISMDQLKAALGKVDLGKLDGMKMQGVQQ